MSWIWLTVPPVEEPRYRQVFPGFGRNVGALRFVLSIAAAIFDLWGFQFLHSIFPSFLLLSPLTEIPFTAFLVQIDLPIILAPQTRELDLVLIQSLPFWWFGEFLLY